MTTTHLIHRAVLHERRAAVVRAEVEIARIPHWLPLALRAVDEYLSVHGVTATGPAFARFTQHGEKATVEAGFPVSKAIAGDTYVVPTRLPHGPVGIAVHCGSREFLDETYTAVRDWLALHGYVQDGPMWEVYLTDPATHPDPASWRTEVVVPYRAL